MLGNRLLWYHASRWQVEGHQDIATQSPPSRLQMAVADRLGLGGLLEKWF